MKLNKRSDAPDTAPEKEVRDTSPGASKKRELSVILYTVILFVAALALILLSYAIHQHSTAVLPGESGYLDEAGPEPGLSINERINGGIEP